jgi:uncharacterized membrane protein YkoI
MRFVQKSVAWIVAGLILACGCWAIADENTDALAKAPKAVRTTVKKVVGKHSLEGFDKEIEDGKTVYEANYKVGETDYAVVVSEDGEIIEQEVEVDISVIPAAVLTAAKKAQPEGKIAEASIVAADGKLFYEIEVAVGKDVHEIKINANGKVTADVVAKPETSKDKDEEDKDKDEKKD